MNELIDTKKVYQHGTLALLVPGLFDGTMTIAELLKHGDSGIGTTSGLSGEMIILDGQAYLVNSDGTVSILAPEDTVPFATVHFQAGQNQLPAVNLSKAAFEKQIAKTFDYHNVFVGVKITGQFKMMKTRVVEKQTKPYPNLTKATRVQPEFTKTNVKGTVMGYYAPALFQGPAVAGYHLHFLDDACEFGGHILDFEIQDAEIQLQPFENFEQHFPIDNADFMATSYDLKQVNDDISEAEH